MISIISLTVYEEVNTENPSMVWVAKENVLMYTMCWPIYVLQYHLLCVVLDAVPESSWFVMRTAMEIMMQDSGGEALRIWERACVIEWVNCIVTIVTMKNLITFGIIQTKANLKSTSWDLWKRKMLNYVTHFLHPGPSTFFDVHTSARKFLMACMLR